MSEDDSGSTAGYVSDTDGSNVSVLNWEQVQRLDAILTETIPIHGRGNFPTLEMQPRQIVKVVRSRMEEKQIHVRDVRLNGSAASHILHEDSGLGYKDLDLIFCADMKGESDFQTVKDIVLDCLLDFLPDCVNKEKITPLTLKVNSPPTLCFLFFFPASVVYFHIYIYGYTFRYVIHFNCNLGQFGSTTTRGLMCN